MSEGCANIIDLLIEQRHNKGMTQKELAKASNLTQSVIARLESKKAIPLRVLKLWRGFFFAALTHYPHLFQSTHTASYPICSCDFKASCNTCERLIFRSSAAAFSHAGKVTVQFTERFTFAMRIDGI